MHDHNRFLINKLDKLDKHFKIEINIIEYLFWGSFQVLEKKFLYFVLHRSLTKKYRRGTRYMVQMYVVNKFSVYLVILIID